MKAVEPVVTSVIPADVAAPHFTGHSPHGRFRFRPEMILIPGVAVLLIGGWEAACRLLAGSMNDERLFVQCAAAPHKYLASSDFGRTLGKCGFG